MATISRLSHYRNILGFDRAEHIPFTRHYRIACSSCEALVINGHASHETGCSNATQECDGCNERIPVSRFRRYCEDCQP
jgi:hypothetical protein